MVINDTLLLEQAPIVDMLREKEKANGVSHGLSEAGYDIRIKQEIHFRRDRHGNRFVTLRDPHVPKGKQGEGNPRRFQQKPGRFILASAIEEFNMPATLVGVVHDKSSWARRGLSVFNTVIELGWKGFLTLELVYHGEEELVIPAGSGIAQVLFQPVAVPRSYDGKYQNQADRPVAARRS